MTPDKESLTLEKIMFAKRDVRVVRVRHLTEHWRNYELRIKMPLDMIHYGPWEWRPYKSHDYYYIARAEAVMLDKVLSGNWSCEWAKAERLRRKNEDSHRRGE